MCILFILFVIDGFVLVAQKYKFDCHFFLLFPFSAPGCVATSTYSSTWLSGGLGRTLVLPFLSRSVSTTTTYQQQSMEWTVGSRRRATTKKCCTQKRRAATTTPAMRWNLHQEKRYNKIFNKNFGLAKTFLTQKSNRAKLLEVTVFIISNMSYCCCAGSLENLKHSTMGYLCATTRNKSFGL